MCFLDQCTAKTTENWTGINAAGGWDKIHWFPVNIYVTFGLQLVWMCVSVVLELPPRHSSLRALDWYSLPLRIFMTNAQSFTIVGVCQTLKNTMTCCQLHLISKFSSLLTTRLQHTSFHTTELHMYSSQCGYRELLGSESEWLHGRGGEVATESTTERGVKRAHHQTGFYR